MGVLLDIWLEIYTILLWFEILEVQGSGTTLLSLTSQTLLPCFEKIHGSFHHYY